MTFTRPILLVTTLTTAASCIKFHARYDGKSHQAAHDAAIPDLRERQVNGPAGGIQSLSKTAILPIFISTNTPIGSIPITASAAIESEQASTSPQATDEPIVEVNPYIFPSSIIQVPVATICPDSPISTGNALINATAFLPNGSSAIYLSTPPNPTNANIFDPSTYSPVPLPSVISVCYPETDPNCPSGPDSIFSPTLIPLPNPISVYPDNTTTTSIDAAERVLANPTARILLAPNGCQTIYAPSYTAVCRTTVQLVGMPVATVTDCKQFATFSSDKIWCGVTAAGTSMPPVSHSGDSGLPLPLPTFTNTPEPGTYYAAHWVDVARGGVPGNVRVEECDRNTSRQGAGGAGGPEGAEGAEVTCQTFGERWTERTITGVVLTESVAEFSGVSTFLLRAFSTDRNDTC